MANVLVQKSSLQAIAAAIRQKNGTQTGYTPAQMAPAIQAISGGSAGLLEPHTFDLSGGYVAAGVWNVGSDTVCYSDVYEVSANRTYLIELGSTVGTRFRAMFSTEDTSLAEANVEGTQIVNTNNPAAYSFRTYTPVSNGYFTISKDNAGHAGLKTYVFDLIDLVNGVGWRGIKVEEIV